MPIMNCCLIKTKWLLGLFTGIIIISMLAGCSTSGTVNKESNNSAKIVTVQDSADRYVEVPHPVNKIVVLWDNPTEAIKVLGAIDRIVGIDVATKALVDKGLYPELKNTPVIGSWDEPNYEKIAELKPDVVIMLSSYSPMPDEVQKQLEPFGIAVVVLDFYQTERYSREIATLGFMLGLEDKAAEYISFYEDTLDMIASRIKEIPDGERKLVYFEAEADFMTYGGAGDGCGIPGMLRAAGAIDLYPEITATTFEVDREDVAKKNPDFIFKGQPAGYFLADDTSFKSVHNSIVARPELAKTKAVSNGDVYVISFDITGGARKIFGPMFLAKIIYPDKFKDFNPESVLKEYTEKYLDRTWKGVYVYSAK